jgi:hypothetical protein
MTYAPEPVAHARPQHRLTLGVSIVGAGASARAWNWPGTKWNRFAHWEYYKRFVQQVVPILQAEGVFPKEYDAPTIRGRFGLPDPRTALGAVPAPAADRGRLTTAAATSSPPSPERP